MMELDEWVYVSNDEEYICNSLEGGGYVILSKEAYKISGNLDESVIAKFKTLQEAMKVIDEYDENNHTG